MFSFHFLMTTVLKHQAGALQQPDEATCLQYAFDKVLQQDFFKRKLALGFSSHNTED